MTLAELCDLVMGQIRHSDAATRALVIAWAKQRHKMLHDAALWRDTLWVRNVTVDADQSEIILPAQFERVIQAKLPNAPLEVQELEHWFQFDPDAWENSGTPAQFSHLAAVAVATLPAGERLQLVSSSASDTAKSVTVEGENNGVQVGETLTLNGTTPVLSTYSYTHPLVLSKASTAGDVTVTGLTSSAVLLQLLSYETQRRHARIRLVEIPTEETTVRVLAKRVCHALRDESAAMTLRGLSGAWQAFTLGDAWKWKRQYSKAGAEFSEGNALLAAAIKAEAWQQAAAVMIRPADPMGDVEIDGFYR